MPPAASAENAAGTTSFEARSNSGEGARRPTRASMLTRNR
jgi:hypothetical protein